jgi:hypothetical protein
MTAWAVYLTADDVKTIVHGQTFTDLAEAIAECKSESTISAMTFAVDLCRHDGVDTWKDFAKLVGLPKVSGRKFGWVVDQVTE